MKKYLTLLLFALAYSGSAQFMEFGAGVGVTGYAGDLIRGYNFSTNRFAGTLFYRMNFSQIVSLKLALTVGSFKSEEVPTDAFASRRNHRFDNSILEVSSVFEYHFLDYKHEKSLVRWSPYTFFGFGFFRMGKLPQGREEGKYQPIVPFGLGVKHLIGYKFSFGFELGVRKTFFDELDGISDADQTVKDYTYGNPRDNDWYFFTGISISFILHEIPCPFSYIPNKTLRLR